MEIGRIAVAKGLDPIELGILSVLLKAKYTEERTEYVQKHDLCKNRDPVIRCSANPFGLRKDKDADRLRAGSQRDRPADGDDLQRLHGE